MQFLKKIRKNLKIIRDKAYKNINSNQVNSKGNKNGPKILDTNFVFGPIEYTYQLNHQIYIAFRFIIYA